MKALAHGVPLVCIPLVGDQPDNAARVVAHGAGIRLDREATPERISAAIQRVLPEPSYGTSARRMAGALAKEDGALTAAEEIESVLRAPARRCEIRAARNRYGPNHRMNPTAGVAPVADTRRPWLPVAGYAERSAAVEIGMSWRMV